MTVSDVPSGMSVLAGLCAAVISYWLNGRTLMFIGDDAVTYGAPVIEETSKTGLALLLGGNILLSHIVFGAVEALYDIIKNRSRLSFTAGVTGFISHAAFGTITVFAGRFLYGPVSGMVVAVIAHMLWNHMIINVKIKNN